MKEKTRLQYATINSISSVLIYFFRLIFQFVNRSIIISILGIKLLGVTHLVTSIIGVLSLAELGVGSAITYALYKPIAKGDIGKRNAYLSLYNRIYKLVAVVILISGILFFPLLKYFTRENIYSFEFYTIYFLILFNSSIGYLMFAYKRSLLDANQKNYIFLIYDFFVFFIFSIIKWIILYFTSDYILFLLLTILTTVVTNIVISIVVEKNNDLKSEISEITEDERNDLKKNILGGFTNQLASVIVFSTDNLLISKFLGIVEVGLYGNYALITGNINIIIKQLTGSHTASVGNLIATSDGDKVEDVFEKYNFINYFFVFYFSLMVLKLISPFVSIWLGDKFLLDKSVVYLLAVYLFVNSYRNCFFVFLGGYGLYWAQRQKAICEAILNIVLSLLFLMLFEMGMSGILLGTICSNILVNIWYEPLLIYKYGLKKDIRKFIKIFLKQCLVYIFSIILISKINFKIENIFEWIVFSIVYSLIIFTLLSLFYFKTKEYKYMVNFFKKIFMKILFKFK